MTASPHWTDRRVPDAVGPYPGTIDEAGTRTKAGGEPGATVRRWVKRTLGIVIMLLVVNHLVLPQLGGARQAADLVNTVNPALLLLAVALALAALVSYAQLTRVALPPEPKIKLLTLFRIQLATKSVTHLVPAGSAAGASLGYRLLTSAGATPGAAGFAIATVSLGSAVVLNVILWLALLVSIPLAGFNPLYGTAAIVGLVLISALAAPVVLLMRGRERAERVVRRVAAAIPFVDPDAAARVLHQVADQLREILARPQLIRHSVGWAATNWLFDAASLWVFLRAFGATVSPVDLLVAFGLANILAAIPITPGGLGVVEAVLISTLVGFGIPRGVASIGVVSYRLVEFWLPIPLGAAAYASLKVGPASLTRTRRQAVRELADEAVALSDRHIWDAEEVSSPTTATGRAPARD